MNEVYAIASKHYPAGDPRPDRLLQMGSDLMNAADERQQQAALENIQRFIGGGMGGFTDVALTPPAGTAFAAFNKAYFALVDELFREANELLQE